MEPKIIIHGGFFSESGTNQEVKKAKQQALSEIVKAAHNYLLNHPAVETAAYAVSLLEDCDLFNAGLGSQIQADGKIRMSASIMDGTSKKFAGVINVEDVKNPVFIAKKLMDFPDSVLCGREALDFARQQGFEYYNPVTKQRREEYEKKREQQSRLGTVGCVALDSEGNLAAATSTGGKGFEIPGRVSDSATVAGNFANEYAAISCTGVGEDIVSAGLAAKIVTRVTDGFSLMDASQKSFEELKPFDGFAGVIGITVDGHIHYQNSHPYMVWASFDQGLKVFSGE
ncbi:isoaspartyl peptidase/L-asparaginase [Rubrolithibacter danxiaensis]|uniref:isoaspartyl peptidase/L-asparaginase n=1 Tax=Rubrolithibacter danxiaensis TaxID=3390805 RepID=UPI003BF81E94